LTGSIRARARDRSVEVPTSIKVAADVAYIGGAERSVTVHLALDGEVVGINIRNFLVGLPRNAVVLNANVHPFAGWRQVGANVIVVKIVANVAIEISIDKVARISFNRTPDLLGRLSVSTRVSTTSMCGIGIWVGVAGGVGICANSALLIVPEYEMSVLVSDI